MTYENLVKEAKKAVKTVDVASIKEHLAVEFDIEGKGEGAFYVEFTSKKVEVEPYEYYDHDFRVRTSGVDAISILKGELDPEAALADGKIVVEGDIRKLALLKEHVKLDAAKPAKKTTTTKKATATKTTTTKKATTTKTTAKKETTAKKAEAEKKPVPKKVEKKPATKVVTK